MKRFAISIELGACSGKTNNPLVKFGEGSFEHK
jgi:hypothetical protein